MRKRRSLSVICLAVIMTLLLILLFGRVKALIRDDGAAHAQASDGTQQVGSTCKITHGKEHFYGSWSTIQLKVVTGGNTFTGYCAQPSKETPEGTFNVSELNNDTIKFLLMCSPGGPLYKQLGPELFKKAGGKDFAYAHAAIGYIYANDLKGLDEDEAQDVKNIVTKVKAWMKEDANAKLMTKYTVYIAKNSDQDIVWLVKTGPDTGYVQLTKKGTQTQLTADNPLYSLAGASFGVYADEDCVTRVETLTTKADGTTDKKEITVGTYYVREDKAPPGYRLDDTVHEVVISDEQTSTLTVEDEPLYAPVDLVVAKVDRETGEAQPLGAASLQGAQFLVEYFAAGEEKDLSTRRWLLQSDEDGTCPMDAEHKLEGDEFYKDSDGQIVLPLGTVVITEVKAPKGYLVNDEKTVIHLTDESGGTEEIIYETPVIEDQVIRGDLEFNKIAEHDQNRLEGIPFTITSQTTEESHTVVTDKNGYICTASEWNPHSRDTNRGETYEDGVWFGGEVEVDDELGALPYDRYRVEEQKCDANEGYKLVSFEIEITRHGIIVFGGTVSNKKNPQPSIGTKAYDKETGEDEIEPGKEVTIIDEVKYEGLEKGEEYTLMGFLMDKESGEHLIVNETVVTADTSFKAEDKEGSEEVSFTLDATDLAGKDLVVFEKLYNKDGEEIASHEDLKSEKQTVHFKSKDEPKKAAKKLTTPGKKATTKRVKTGDILDLLDWILIALITACFVASQLEDRLLKKA